MRVPLCAVAGALLLTGCSSAPPPSAPPLRAGAVLKDRDGKEVGRATFVDSGGVVRISVTGNGLPPGPKGVGIHANGVCEPPLFVSAGPRRRGGSLPPLVVGAGGNGSVEAVDRDVTLGPGRGSLLDGSGSSIIFQDRPAGATSDPLGQDGSRIACGVIARE